MHVNIIVIRVTHITCLHLFRINFQTIRRPGKHLKKNTNTTRHSWNLLVNFCNWKFYINQKSAYNF